MSGLEEHDTHGLILLAIPVFLGLMLLEGLVARAQGRRVYRFEDTVSNLGAGLGQSSLDVFLGALFVALYARVHERHALVTWDSWSPAGLLALLLLIDLQYYWYHRLSHRVGFMWAIHQVHHHSEQLNYSVGLRQAWFQKLTSVWFYLPNALLGFDARSLVAVVAIHAVVQLWTHTQVYDGPRWLRWLLVTPTHHRVHHGRNARYLHTNFAGVLSVWDHLFRSYVPEGEPVDYGVVDPPGGYDPLWANLYGWATLLGAKAAPRRVEPTPAGPGRRAYVVVQLAVILGAYLLLATEAKRWALPLGLGLAAWIVLSLGSLGLVCDRRRLSLFTEPARLLLLLLVAGLGLGGGRLPG